MSRELCLQAGLTEEKAQALEAKLQELGLSINWQALYQFVALAAQKRGELTINELVNAVMAIFGLTPPQLLGVAGPAFNITALVKLVMDIRNGAGTATLIADVIALITS